MYNQIAKLVLYRDLGENSILVNLAEIFRACDNEEAGKDELITRIFEQIKRILDLATSYGFDKNLWQNYLTYILVTNENSFTLTCEGVGAGEGTVNTLAKHDYEIFLKLFCYDFSDIEKKLGIDCFSIITNYKSLPKKEQMYNKNVSQKVIKLSEAISKSVSADEVFDLTTDVYNHYGV